MLDLSVLFVEDDLVAAERLSAVLKRETRTVVTAADGLAGLAAFRKHFPDIVVTDIRMPRMSGIEMAREIRRLNEDVPVIMTSAHNETEYFREAIDIGVDHYILKPVDQKVLLQAIRKGSERLLLGQARKEAEEALRLANASLEQRVRERTGELERALIAIIHSKQEWQDTFDAIRDPISIVNLDYRIVKSNKAFAEKRGLHPRDAIGRKCFEQFCDFQTAGKDCPHAKTLVDGQPHSAEIRSISDGRIFRVSTFPHRDPDGKLIGTIHISHDITDEKERELGMILNERLSILGQMTAGIAHELKSPLTTISGFAEIISGKLEKDDLDREIIGKYLGTITDEVFRCSDIINSVLSTVQKKAFEEKNVHLEKVLEKTIELIRYQGRLRSVQITRNFAGQVPAVSASEGLLQQIFLIIVINALDAIEDRGSLTLATAAEDGQSVARITDTGPGIPSHQVNRIFDAFFTTKGEKNGTGLGLSIAKRIVSSLKGTLDVETTGPGGTTFRVGFPVRASQ